MNSNATPREPLRGHGGGAHDAQFAELSAAAATRRCREEIGFGTFDSRGGSGPALPVLPSRANQRRTGQDLHRATHVLSTQSDLPPGRLSCAKRAGRPRAEALGIPTSLPSSGGTRDGHPRGVQGRVALRDRCWVDEMFFEDSSLRNTRCPCVRNLLWCGGDRRAQEPVAVVCGQASPQEEGREALGGRMPRDDHRPRHGEGARPALRPRKAPRRTPGTRVPRGDEDGQQPRAWIRRYVEVRGDEAANLQEYLDWYVYLFRVRRTERWPKTARVLRHLMLTDARYRSSRVR